MWTSRKKYPNRKWRIISPPEQVVIQVLQSLFELRISFSTNGAFQITGISIAAFCGQIIGLVWTVVRSSAYCVSHSIMSKREDVVFVVDELERSLYPKLTEHFLKLFMEAPGADRVQLVFTTHEDTIMDQELFRRNEIWFVERDGTNASRIYSLDRFSRKDMIRNWVKLIWKAAMVRDNVQ